MILLRTVDVLDEGEREENVIHYFPALVDLSGMRVLNGGRGVSVVMWRGYS